MPTQAELFLEKTMLYISKYCPRQEINFRKMKKLLKNLTKYSKNIATCISKKKFSPRRRWKQFFYFGLIAIQFCNWFQSSTNYKVQ